MQTLESYLPNQRIIEDFSARTLAAIPTDYGRLLYLTSLRDLASGRYAHEGLESLYPAPAVQQALAYCHEEIYARILETSLEQQEWDLRACLTALEGDFWEIVELWKEDESYRALAPPGMPAYLRDLFCSNVRVLLDVLVQDRTIWTAAA